MKLSQLVYECVKDSITMRGSMSYESFINDIFFPQDSKDYSLQYAVVFDAINKAIARLQSYNKIPYKLMFLSTTKQFVFPFGKPLIIVDAINKNRIDFYELGNKEILLTTANENNNIWVEYKVVVPHFSEKDIKKIELDEDNELLSVDTNIDLEQTYGITDEMANYIKEFVKGQTLETIAPDIANNHNNRAEQYFGSLENARSQFPQRKIRNTHRGLW